MNKKFDSEKLRMLDWLKRSLKALKGENDPTVINDLEKYIGELDANRSIPKSLIKTYTVAQTDKEWGTMWEALMDDPVNAGLKDVKTATDAKTGEAWQYVETAWREGEWKHSFQHRCHPKTGKREDIFIPVSFDYYNLNISFIKSGKGEK